MNPKAGTAGRAKAGGGGFTLLEVLVALAILGIALTVVLQLFAANLRALSASEDYLEASLAGEARLRDIAETVPLAEASWSEVTAEGYRVEAAVVEVEKERTDTLPLRLMDVSVTLRWNWGQKNRQLTLRTFKTIEKERPASMISPALR
jgi:general secretion pathway protein I